MDGLQALLHEREEAIVGRWLEDTLADYPSDGARAFSRERDEFANPVGHSLRTGTRAIFEALVDDTDDGALHRALDDILGIRAVQQLPPARAVGFLFHLKDLLHAELDGASADPGLREALEALDRRIDGAVLSAFETYVGYRELVAELRIAEVKRTVPWAARRRRGKE
jgi:hypothetical protein